MKSSGFSFLAFAVDSVLQTALIKTQDGRFALKYADLASQSSCGIEQKKAHRGNRNTQQKVMPTMVCLDQEQHIYFLSVLQNSWSWVSTHGAPHQSQGLNLLL